MRKNSLNVKKLLECGKVPSMWKTSLIVENLLSAQKIRGLIISKANTNVETIKTYISNLGQKLIILNFFVVDKINIMCSKRCKQKY